MSHDEIIAKMDDFNIGLSNGFGDVKTLVQFVNALRAVVELHTDDYGLCLTCEMKDYPCATVRAIEKEING
jgi:carbamoylphosphate synthase small subunit